MNTVTSDPIEAVNAAVHFEQEGHRILSDASEKAQDPLSRATFRFLADQELKHIEIIKKFAASLANEGSFDASVLNTPITKLQAEEQIKGIFSQFKSKFEESVGAAEERQAVYKVALDMEHHGHDFYRNAAEQATNETAKKLFQFLTEEESRHFEIIQDTADFLKQPDAFMAVEERWMQI